MSSFTKFLIAVVCTVLAIALLVGICVWLYNDENALGWAMSSTIAGIGSAIAVILIGYFLTIFLTAVDDPKIGAYKTTFLVILWLIGTIILTKIIGPMSP